MGLQSPRAPICQTYIFILIHNVHSSSLELAHHSKICPHWSSDKNVIKAVPVNVAGSDGVAKVSPNLISREIVQICQVRVVEDNLETSL